MTKNKFPSLAVVILIWAVMWLLNDLGIVSLDLPWIPVVIIAIAVGMIYNRLK